jgi:hypothetical protein
VATKNANAKRWLLRPHATAGRVFSSAYPPPIEPGAISSGIVFPSNGEGGVSNVRFHLIGANLPNIVPLTLLWKVAPFQHTSYYTTFFHGRTDGTFVGDNTYFGCHPYPDGGAGGTTHKWEISIEGTDDVVDENGNDTAVVKGTLADPIWYSQAAVAQNISSEGDVDLWWHLRESISHRINHNLNGSALVNASQSPAITFGDAPWAANNERLSGILRGIQIYASALSITHIVALEALETDASVLAYCTVNSITPWYVNMNPTPSDITDKSGAGHHPAWVSSDHGTLWTP